MKNIIFIIISIISLCSCSINKITLQNGDFIFVEAETKNLSGAISRVTKNNHTKISFDHIAMVEINNNNTFVIESIPKKGSHKQSLKSYLKEHKSKKLYIYRLKKEYAHCIDNAISSANQMLRKPYNYTYIPNENEYYCSDFVERAYRKCNIFELQPMSFINPTTGKTDEYWIQYYNKLHTTIPEGKLGCNPNGLSQSNKIIKIGILK